eukprot:476642-Rhodomonas_salina.1
MSGTDPPTSVRLYSDRDPLCWLLIYARRGTAIRDARYRYTQCQIPPYAVSATPIRCVSYCHTRFRTRPYAMHVHCEIKHKETHSWYKLCGDCVFLSLISRCRQKETRGNKKTATKNERKVCLRGWKERARTVVGVDEAHGVERLASLEYRLHLLRHPTSAPLIPHLSISGPLHSSASDLSSGTSHRGSTCYRSTAYAISVPHIGKGVHKEVPHIQQDVRKEVPQMEQGVRREEEEPTRDASTFNSSENLEHSSGSAVRV